MIKKEEEKFYIKCHRSFMCRQFIVDVKSLIEDDRNPKGKPFLSLQTSQINQPWYWRLTSFIHTFNLDILSCFDASVYSCAILAVIRTKVR